MSDADVVSAFFSMSKQIALGSLALFCPVGEKHIYAVAGGEMLKTPRRHLLPGTHVPIQASRASNNMFGIESLEEVIPFIRTSL